MIGVVVIGGVGLTITDLLLINGKLRIVVTARGPIPLIHLKDYAVYGHDGTLVYRSSRPGETATVGPLGVKDMVDIDLNLEINGHVSQPSGPVHVVVGDGNPLT